jgi:hypothetical protein
MSHSFPTRRSSDLAVPPQIQASQERHFFYSSVDPANELKVQFIEYIETDFGAEFRPVIFPVGDTSRADGFLFEPNDKITRDQLKQIIESSMNDLVAKRGIYDYLVVCDNSNNTPDRIARNEMYVDIAIEPMKGVEFIYVPIRLVNPGTLGSLGT